MYIYILYLKVMYIYIYRYVICILYIYIYIYIFNIYIYTHALSQQFVSGALEKNTQVTISDFSLFFFAATGDYSAQLRTYEPTVDGSENPNNHR